jgi:hypothetical protein
MHIALYSEFDGTVCIDRIKTAILMLDIQNLFSIASIFALTSQVSESADYVWVLLCPEHP